jgi:DNA-3-methyladenine glycosylase
MVFNKAFFERDCLDVAPDLVGKIIAHKIGDEVIKLRISETEAYRGEEDTACHAHIGRTPRTEVLYMEAGTIYVYLCYGVHYLLNIITEKENIPQGVLIRACVEAEGPGKLTKKLKITKELNKQSIINNPEIWLEDDGMIVELDYDKRVGIDYADEVDRNRLWRYKLSKKV